MTGAVLSWVAGGGVSVALHLGLAAALTLSVDPQPVEQQPMPEARLDLAAYAVQSSTAEPEQPSTEAAPSEATNPTAVSQDAIPQSRAEAQTAKSEPAAAIAPSAQSLAPSAVAAAPVAASVDAAQTRIAASAAPLAPAQPLAAPANRVAPADVPAEKAESADARSQSVAASAAPTARIAEASTTQTAVKPVTDSGSTVTAAAAVPSQAAVELAAPAASIAAAPERPEALAPVANPGDQAVPATAATTSAQAVALPQATVVTAAPAASSERATATALPQTALAATADPAPTTVGAAPVSAEVVPGLAANDSAEAVSPDKVASVPAALVAAIGPSLASAPPQAQPAPSAPLPAEFATASLAWSGSDQSVDPVSLAAIQAFMQPGDLAASASNAGSVRDGLEAILASVPCSRLQVEFVPETGALELRGHIPEEGLRQPLLALLQAQVGKTIPVTDNIRILPRPQCGALSAIASVGLPSSTDQLSNPKVMGAGAHAREFPYKAGQRLVIEMTAPDYDAFVYIDYFDSSGSVIHLIPSATAPLVKYQAKSAMTFGNDRDGQSTFSVTLGPPYGQEIAVAFAASAPLSEEVRPQVEPADRYLAWLQDRVSEARAADPDFKGEWVYFFVITSETGP